MKPSLFRHVALSTLMLAAGTALAYEGGAAGAASISGKVGFKGAVPATKKLPITKDNAVCGSGEREIVEVNVKQGALAGAVVYVTGLTKGKDWGPLAAPVLDQKGCRFAPEVIVTRKDGELTVRNSDPVLHNIHTYEIIGKVRRTMFNVGQPDKGDLKQPIKVRRSNAVKIECDAHDFMHGWAFAADNPYAVTTKDDGSFTIDGLPEGTYEVKVWHPVLGEKSVQVAAKGATTANFEFAQ